MKLALFSLALSSLAFFPTTLAAAIDLSEDSTDLPTDSPTDLSTDSPIDWSTDSSNDSTDSPNDSTDSPNDSTDSPNDSTDSPNDSTDSSNDSTDSTDSTTKASEFLPPLNVNFQPNTVTDMEALNFITNLTNALIAEVSQYAELSGISVTDLISFPCTPASASAQGPAQAPASAQSPTENDGLRF